MNESDLDEEEQTTELTLEEAQQTMRENFIINAKEEPWGWEWKYTTAFMMLNQGRPIDFIKKILGVSTPWLRRHKLIENN